MARFAKLPETVGLRKMDAGGGGLPLLLASLARELLASLARDAGDGGQATG